MSLEVKHLTHTYSAGSAFQATAVHDVSLTIEDGEFVCIVGHTGSGKSTLVQHLNGLLKPTSGQVLVDGEDMNGEGVDRRRIRQKVGLVFQYPEYQLFEETIAKDIAFGPKNQGLSEEEIDQRVRRAMRMCIWTTTSTPSAARSTSPADRCAAWRLRACWRWSRRC